MTTPEDNPQSDEQPAVMLCPSCMESNAENADFCHKCGAPVGTFATLDPMKSIYSRGWMFRKAISGRTSSFVFWGMWLIFGPATLFNVVALYGTVDSWRWSGGTSTAALPFLLLSFFLVLNVAILFLVTRSHLRYRRRRRARAGVCEECGYDLRGLPEHRCPECGTRFDPEYWQRDPEDWATSVRRQAK